jgi:uncharacterized protein (TIGR02246 family)
VRQPLAESVVNSIDAWNSGDLDAFIAAYHGDAVLLMIGGFEGLVGRELRGRDEIRAFFADFLEQFARTHVETESARWVGERMLLIQRQESRARTGGVETAFRWGSLISFRDGLIYRQENYYEVDDALAAAGLADAGG